MSTCGQCYFGKLIPQDLKARACFGAPPAPVALPAPNGMGVQVRMLRPMVGADDEACSLFRARAAQELPLPTSVPMTVVTQMNEPIPPELQVEAPTAPMPVHKKFAMGVDAQVIKAGSNNNVDNRGGA